MTGSPAVFVSGATGFVGRMLVEDLVAEGVEVVAVGRSIERMTAVLAPSVRCATHEDWQSSAREGDVFVHLAALNTDSAAGAGEFDEINVQLPVDLARRAAEAGMARFLFASSVHALDDTNRTNYAESKRRAGVALQEIEGVEIEVGYLAAVYGDDRFAGKLRVLRAVPSPLRRLLVQVLGAAKPLCNRRRLRDWVIEGPADDLRLRDDLSTNRFYATFSRCLDLSFAIAVILAFGWLIALAWLAVRLTSRGPGIFAQVRIGRDGKPFTCYKVRTMAQGTASVGTHLVSEASVTPVGVMLRRLKLDELPQVANLLKGEMSLVGPRPCLPNQVELVEARQRRGVDRAMPGITGLAQVNDIDMSDPERLADWDARYLALQGILIDISLVVATFLGRGRGDRVRSEGED